MRMKPWAVLLLVLLTQVGCARDVPMERNIKAQLHGPFLILRGMYDGSKLKFDAQGNLVGSAQTLPFGLSAARLDKVTVTGSEAELEVTREGLVFSGPPKIGTPEHVSAEPWGKNDRAEIDIALDAQHPEELQSALTKVFSVGFDPALINGAPEAWHPWLRHELDPAVHLEPSAGATDGATCVNFKKDCPGVIGPILTHTIEPTFSPVAKRRRYQGVSVVGLIVDVSGRPQDLRIVRPLGMGLDERAVDAVSQYRFKPAQYEGKPVPVYVNVEVDFHIY